MTCSSTVHLLPLLVTTLLIILTVHGAAAVDPLFNFCSSSSQSSSSTPNHPANFADNLKTVFRQLANQAPPTGFAKVSAGDGSDGRIYGVALCRADVTSAAVCKSCITTAAREITALCPSNRSAVIWYDNCMVKYSDTNFLGKVDNAQRFYMWNTQVVADPSVFNLKTKDLLTGLAKEAAATGSKLFAAGEAEIDAGAVRVGGEPGKKEKLYGLVQCSRDLSGENCGSCLKAIIQELPSCCDGKQGGRVVGGSCNFRYEIYPFLNGGAA